MKPGDSLSIHIGGYDWNVTVLQLSDKRSAAPIARLLYEESQESRALREAEAARRRMTTEPAITRKGRPTKRDRRDLERWSDAD